MNKCHNVTRTFAAAALFLWPCSFGSVARAESLIIQGSSTFATELMTPHQNAIEMLSGQSLKIISLRSDSGLLRLLKSNANLAMVSTSLQNAIAVLRETYPELPYDRLKSFSVLRTRVAFAIHPSNPVRDADLGTVKRILSGEVRNWQKLGGPDLLIRTVFVPEGGVVLTVVRELFEGSQILAPPTMRVRTGKDVVKVVGQEPAALGVAQLGLVHEHQLAELRTDRPIEQELNLVTLGEPTPAEQAVIDAARTIARAKYN